MPAVTEERSWSSAVPLWLNGKEIHTTNTFDVVSPKDGRTLYKSAAASVEDAERALQSANDAFESWSATKPALRRDIFYRAADILEKRREECFKLINEETGAGEMLFDLDFAGGVEVCRSTAGLIAAVQGRVPALKEEGRSGIVVREPFGTVLAIAPWNAPHTLGIRACVGPLAMGNTVILKGAEACPGVYWAISSALHEAGLPAGCLNTLIHTPQDAAAVTSHLIQSPIIKKIGFTGSTRTGAIIASQAAKLIKPTVMELGGKASAIVCDDADISKAAFSAALGAFFHGGQICMSTERILVHRSIADKFIEELKPASDKIFGNGAALNLVNETPVKKNTQLVEDAVSKGARIAHGKLEETKEKPAYMAPVILDNVREGMEIYHNESFGPTVSLLSFDTDEEAIKLANDTDYGLTAAVFTEDLRKGIRIARKIQSGAVHINSMTIHDEAALPHGGWKSSGFGRFNGVEGLEEWVQTKSITWRD